MISQDDLHTNHIAVRQMVDRYIEAIRNKDIEGVMAVYAADLVAFDLIPPLKFVGAETFRAIWRVVFETFEGPIPYDVRDLQIVAGDDVAFCHSLNRNRGRMKSGAAANLWLRWTAGFRKLDGAWRITHLHVSIPADLRNGQAVLDAQP